MRTQELSKCVAKGEGAGNVEGPDPQGPVCPTRSLTLRVGMEPVAFPAASPAQRVPGVTENQMRCQIPPGYNPEILEGWQALTTFWTSREIMFCLGKAFLGQAALRKHILRQGLDQVRTD